MHFTKMQGIGNDYVYVNCFEETVRDPEALAVRISRPHFGVGSDGLVLIEPSDVADFGMRIFNSDGSESEMCGNATRCIGKYVYERGLTDKTEPPKVEEELRKLIPPEKSSDFCHRIVIFGRDYCRARNPKCAECPLKKYLSEENKEFACRL